MPVTTASHIIYDTKPKKHMKRSTLTLCYHISQWVGQRVGQGKKDSNVHSKLTNII